MKAKLDVADLTPPDGHRVVVVDTPSSAEIRDLASYRRDLELAKVYANEFASLDSSDLNDSRDPRLAFWHAAVVAYGRAFNSGVRTTRLDIQGFDDDETEAHDYFIDLRNKHFAHAVNDYEQTVVIAYLTDSAFASRALTRTGQIHVEMLAAEEEDLTMFVQLCDRSIRQINRRLHELHVLVGEEIVALGLDAVYALPDVVLRAAQRSTVSKRRK